jgi:NCK-associated protein 1
VLARCFTLVTFQTTKSVQKQDIPAFIKTLAKRMPELPDNVDKQKGYDDFVSAAREIVLDLQPFYHTFVDLLNFTDAAWQALQDMAVTTSQLSMTGCPDFAALYLNLFVTHAKVHLLVQRLDGLASIVMAFAYAHTVAEKANPDNTLSTSIQEPSFNRIVSYLTTWAYGNCGTGSDVAMKRLQTEFSEVHPLLSTTVTALFPEIMKWHDATSLIANNHLFDVTDKTATMGQPTNSTEYAQLSQRGDVREWTLWVFLLCPETLTQQGGVDVLSMLLRDVLVVTLYRSQTIAVHREFEQLFVWYKSPAGVKLSKFKKSLKDAQDPEGMCASHAKRRCYLRHQLASIVAFFQAHPGVLAPKIQMLFAALRLARHEVLWFFKHTDAPAHFKKKYDAATTLEEPIGGDTHLSALVYHCTQLRELCMLHQQLIRSYHVKYLRGPDTRKLQAAMNDLQASNVNVSGGVRAYLADIGGAVADMGVGDDLEGVRLDWYRCTASLFVTGNGVKPEQLTTLTVSRACVCVCVFFAFCMLMM